MAMDRIGKISMIVKDYDPRIISMENSLRQNGFERVPGTKRIIFPFKENSGLYRTGLDENALYIQRIKDGDFRLHEQKRVKLLREELETALGIDLGPRSQYYNYNSDLALKVVPFKLTERDSIFNLNEPISAVTFAWVSVHPAIAPSLEAYLRGDVSPDTQYFVNDDEIGNKIIYDKKKILNDAIAKLNSLSIEKRKKIAALMGLPFSENAKEDAIYNALDDLIRLREVPNGTYKGRVPVNVFTTLVELNSDLLEVSYLVDQAFNNQIYRFNKGRVYEGEMVAFESREELIDHLMNPKNQPDLMALQKKLEFNKFKA